MSSPKSVPKMSTIQFPTPKHFTVYWRPESVDRELGIGAMFDHVPSDQLVHIRAARGDTLWLVTADDSNRLFLAGRLKIDKICDRATVRKTVKGRGLWDATHHAFAARLAAEPYRKLKLDSTKLQFVSPTDRLDPKTHFGNQLQQMRLLSPASVNLLQAIWDGQRSEPQTPPADVVSPLSLQELRQRAIDDSAESRSPQGSSTRRRWRSYNVKLYVLVRAHGKCEGCGAPAPFRTPNGNPYLEPHHIRRLSDDGPDHPRWVIALCPNCHRRAEYSADAEQFKAVLAAIALKLERASPRAA